MLTYNNVHKDIKIEWLEDKKNKGEPFILRRKVLFCQVDPLNDQRIIRAHLVGKKPSWIDRMILSKAGQKYSVTEVNTGNGEGFVIYETKSSNLTCPFIKGMIEEWFSEIDEQHHTYKERLITHLDIVEKNLKHYSEVFHEFGLIFKSEEIDGLYGSMILNGENLKPTDDWTGSLFQFERCIDSLVEIRDYPIEEVIETEIIEEALELPLAEELDEEPLAEETMNKEEEGTIVELPRLEDELISNELTEEPITDEIISQEIIETEIISNEMIMEELTEEPTTNQNIKEEVSESEIIDELTEGPVTEQVIKEETEIKDDEMVMVSDELTDEPINDKILDLETKSIENTGDPNNKVDTQYDIPTEKMVEQQKEIKVAKKNDAKGGILAGQILLF